MGCGTRHQEIVSGHNPFCIWYRFLDRLASQFTARVRVYKATNLLTISSPTPHQDFDPFSVSVPSGVYVG